MNILVTGGAGYIGSHTCIELLNAGYNVIVVDNLSNSKEESLIRVREITGKELAFFKVDILDEVGLTKVFSACDVDAVIHFAGLKAVGESVTSPMKYYQNNVAGSLVLFGVMTNFGVKDLVFSSSATVYGDPDSVPITEEFPLRATNPYGRTKLIIEDLLRDIYASDHKWNIALLRYFNPVGAHPSGRIGEDPNGIPNNLMPYITQVAVGKLDQLMVFGGDYPTPDGTGVRDYIHVIDLARGHLKAIDRLVSNPGVVAYNLGTGHGYSVLEVVSAFQRACGKNIPYQITERRPGDIAESFANPARANKELEWKTQFGIEDICADSWRWQSQNPNGYD